MLLGPFRAALSLSLSLFTDTRSHPQTLYNVVHPFLCGRRRTAQIGDLAKILTSEYGRVGGSAGAELLDCLAHGGQSAPLELWLGRSIIAEGQVNRLARLADGAADAVERELEAGLLRCGRLLAAHAAELHAWVASDVANASLATLGFGGFGGGEDFSALLAASEALVLTAEACVVAVREAGDRLRLLARWLRAILTPKGAQAAAHAGAGAPPPHASCGLSSGEVSTLVAVLEAGVRRETAEALGATAAAAEAAAVEAAANALARAAAEGKEEEDDGFGGGGSYKSSLASAKASAGATAVAPKHAAMGGAKAKKAADSQRAEALLAVAVGPFFAPGVVPSPSASSGASSPFHGAGGGAGGGGLLIGDTEGGGGLSWAAALAQAQPLIGCGGSGASLSLRSQVLRVAELATAAFRRPLAEASPSVASCAACNAPHALFHEQRHELRHELRHEPGPAGIALKALAGALSPEEEDNEEDGDGGASKGVSAARGSVLAAFVCPRGLKFARSADDGNEARDVVCLVQRVRGAPGSGGSGAFGCGPSGDGGTAALSSLLSAFGPSPAFLGHATGHAPGPAVPKEFFGAEGLGPWGHSLSRGSAFWSRGSRSGGSCALAPAEWSVAAVRCPTAPASSSSLSSSSSSSSSTRVVALALYGSEPTTAALNPEHPERLVLLARDQPATTSVASHRLVTVNLDAVPFTAVAAPSVCGEGGDGTEGADLHRWFAAVAPFEPRSGADAGVAADGQGDEEDDEDEDSAPLRWRALPSGAAGAEPRAVFGNGCRGMAAVATPEFLALFDVEEDEDDESDNDGDDGGEASDGMEEHSAL